MADAKISALAGATTPLAGTEVLPIVQSGATRKVATDNLTVKNIRSNATSGILQIAGPTAAATRTMTVPDANFTAARTDTAQTFTGLQTFGSGITSSGITSNGNILLDGSGNPTIVLKTSGGGNNPLYRIQADTNFWDMIGVFSDADDTYRVRYNNTDYFQINNVGEAKINVGNLAFASGQGIDFSATPGTGTSELLNDYEEGTFTPALTPAAGTITSFTLGTCNYTKVGRMVTVNFSGTITNAGTGVGALNVTLPFTNGAAISNGTGRENVLTGSQLQATVLASSSAMDIQTYANSTAIGTNAQIRITLTYFV